jgi:chaperonin GroES
MLRFEEGQTVEPILADEALPIQVLEPVPLEATHQSGSFARSTKSGLKPGMGRIVVSSSELEQAAARGQVMVDDDNAHSRIGRVVAVGPGEPTGFSPADIHVGDVVLYSKYGGTEIAVDGEDLLVLNGRDVLAVVEK